MIENFDNWTPENFHLIAERAYQLHLQGQHGQALTIICGLLALDPGNPYCLDAAAALSLALGRPADAVQYASLLLDTYPHHGQALARRCEANLLLGRLQEARDDLSLLKRAGSEELYRQACMRLTAASSLLDHPAKTERLRQLKTITE